MRLSYNEDTKPLTVEAIENHIYFYSAVDTDRCLALMQLLREQDRILQTEKLTRNVNTVTPIWLHIQSFGGDFFASFSVVDQIRQLKTPVYSIIEGTAASGATIISVGCKKRYIQPHAFMMIHQIYTYFEGTHEDLKIETTLMDMLSSSMYEWYAQHTKLTRAELQEKTQRDFWMNAQQALEYGFVDEVLK